MIRLRLALLAFSLGVFGCGADRADVAPDMACPTSCLSGDVLVVLRGSCSCEPNPCPDAGADWCCNDWCMRHGYGCGSCGDYGRGFEVACVVCG